MPRNPNVEVRITGDPTGFDRAVKSAEDSAKAFERELNKLEQQQAKVHRSMTQVGYGVTAFGAAVLAGLGVATKAAIDWESAWAGVTKTVNGSQQQMDALEKGLRGLATTLPASHDEIAAVAEAAGQLGIKRDAIVGFTKTMIDMGVSTNLTADEAATSMARLANIMQTPQKDIQRLGSTIVALGNSGASTEAEITEMALRIAGAGHTVGLSESDVLGFANALSSVGINAEAGGSAISRVFITIASAVEKGGAKLDEFAKVAGVSASEYAQKFKTDAAGATTDFIEGLGRMQKSGQSTFGVLKDLGLGEIRVRDAMLRAAGAGDLFRQSLEQGSKAWKDNTALVAEANKRYETTESKLKIARNQVHDFAIDMGEVLLPVVGGAADKFAALIDVVQDLPGPMKTALTGLAAATGATATLGGAALIAVPKIHEFMGALDGMGPRGAKVAGGLRSVTRVLGGPWGLAIGAGIAALGIFAAKRVEAAQETREFTRAIQADSGALGANTSELIAHKLQQDGAIDIAKSYGLTVQDLVGKITGQKDSTERVNAAIEKYGYATVFATEMSGQRGMTGSAKALTGVLDSTTEAYAKASEKAKENAAISDAVKQALGGAAGAEGALGDAAGDATTALDKQKQAVDDLKSALDALNGVHLTERQAARQYQQAIDDATAAVAKNGRTLDINTQAGRDNQAALDDVAKSANDLIGAQADANVSTEQLHATMEKQRQKLIAVATRFGMTKAEAREYADQVLQIPPNVSTTVQLKGAKGALATANDLNQALSDFANKHYAASVEVHGLAYAQRQLQSVIKNSRFLSSADGNIIRYYADGGENHVAQVAPAGSWRVWAEPETGGEAYIPLAESKRGRSTAILGQVAQEFGYQLVHAARGQFFTSAAGGAATAAGTQVTVQVYPPAETSPERIGMDVARRLSMAGVS